MLYFITTKNYVVNYRYLKLALSLDVKLEKVNGVLQYIQSDFMLKYIMKIRIQECNVKMNLKKTFIN